MPDVTLLYSFDLPHGSQAIASTPEPDQDEEFFIRIRTCVLRWRFGLGTGRHSITIDSRIAQAGDRHRELLEAVARRWNEDPECVALVDTHIELVFTCRGHAWIGASTALQAAGNGGTQALMKRVSYPGQNPDVARDPEARASAWPR